MNDEYILEVNNLKQHFPIRTGFFQRVTGHIKAVDGVSFAVKRNEVLGLVGESGCGKTTVGRTVLRLYDPTAGDIWYRTERGERINVAALKARDIKPLRREMRMIFQDPFSSLNPRRTVKDLIGEPLLIHGIAKGKAMEDRVAALMTEVGLDPNYMERYPHEFSGGQRQRIGIARTLSLSPRLIIADEPVSALDVSVQAQVLNLLQGLKDELGLTLVFIAHDLSVVEHISDRIAVLYVGKIVEMATSEAFCATRCTPTPRRWCPRCRRPTRTSRRSASSWRAMCPARPTHRPAASFPTRSPLRHGSTCVRRSRAGVWSNRIILPPVISPKSCVWPALTWLISKPIVFPPC